MESNIPYIAATRDYFRGSLSCKYLLLNCLRKFEDALYDNRL